MKKNYFSFLVVLSLASINNVSAQTPITDANFNEAIANCLSTNPVDGLCSESEYGAMPSWDVSNMTDMSNAFVDKTNFNADISNWDVSSVTNMHWMFVNSGFNQPIGDWDVSNVTNMNSLFYGTDFNQTIGDWDVSNVTDMVGMFEKSSFNQPIGNWDVSSVTTMEVMFRDATSYSTANYVSLLNGWASLPTLQPNVIFDAPPTSYCNGETARSYIINTYGWTITDGGLDCTSLTPITDANIHEAVNLWKSDQSTAEATYGYISDWDTSNITNMFGLFAGLDINPPIGNWDVSNVTNMSWMFESSNFNQSIGDWDVSSVTNMSVMFENSDFNQPIGNWNVSRVTDMSSMFYYAFDFNQPIGTWNVSSVTDMSRMFYYAFDFNQPIGTWNVSNVTDMSSMFYRALNFNQPIGNWDVSSATNMDFMFMAQGAINGWGIYYGSSFNQPIGNWDVSNVKSMKEMFHGAAVFNQPIWNWDVSSVTNMSGMFKGEWIRNDWDGDSPTCYRTKFNQDIGGWNVSNVIDMSSMFDKSQFNQSIESWDVSSVTNMAEMFKASLFNQDISNWDVSSVTNMSGMFSGDYAFNGGSNTEVIIEALNLKENYDNLLIGWASLLKLQPNVIFSGGSSTYCDGETAREYIINTYGWTIYDAGLDCTNVAINCLTVEDADAYLGLNDFKVTLESSEIIKGFQFDITFPDGFVFNPNDITNTGLPENFQVSCADVGGNAFRVVGFSLTNETIASGTTSILTFPTFINEGTLSGEYPIPITNLTLSNVNNIDIASICPTDGVITIYSYPIGDANEDYSINILDILGEIDYIFGYNPSPFNVTLADVNFDSVINILDVLGTQDIILGVTTKISEGKDDVLGTKSSLVGNNYLVVKSKAASSNTTTTIDVEMKNDDVVKGIQFDLVLPTGFTFNPADITATSRLAGFNVSASQVGTNTYTFLVFSLSSATVSVGTGVILNLNLFIESTVSNGDYPLVFTNVIISDTNNTDVSTVATSIGEISVGTLGINDFTNSENQFTLYPNPTKDIFYLKVDLSIIKLVEIYSLTGQKVMNIQNDFSEINLSQLESGIYFVRVKTEYSSKMFRVIKE